LTELPKKLFKNVWKPAYHACIGEWIVLVTDISKVIEKKHADHPEEDHGDEDNNNQSTVYGAVHLENIFI
jgi:hypothetical protein